MRKSPKKRSRRLPLPCAALAMLLLLALLAACAVEENDGSSEDRADSRESASFDRSGDEDRSSGGSSIFSSRATDTPEPTDDARDQGSGSSAIFPGSTGTTPGDETEPTSALPLTAAQGPPCPRREPDPDVVLSPSGTSPETDKEALIALFEDTGGETWDTSSTWAGLLPIGEWNGVGVGGDTPSFQLAEQPTPMPAPSRAVDDANPSDEGADQGRVTGLVLSGLTGELPAELGNLTSLQELTISNSQLTGGLPRELGNLSSIRTLSITDSEIAGDLPPELGNLTSLETLHLGGNQLCGEIPPELDGLTGLRELDLGRNQLTGRLPDALASLARLETLSLAHNQLSGEVPSWLAGLTELTALDLGNNQLTGELPPDLDQLAPGLELLGLQGNQLTGCYSDFLRDSVSIATTLEVCIPNNHPGDTEALIALHRAWGQPSLNNWLSREPISEWQGVSVDSGGRVAALRLSNLTGELPAELGNLTSLRSMWISAMEGGHLRCSPDAKRQQGTFLAGVCELETVGFASVSAGGYHTCGVRTNGAVACWGSNEDGRATPPAGEFASVSAGLDHTCGVRTNAAVACWGSNENGAASPPEGEFASVSAGYFHSCGVRTNGALSCWGLNGTGAASPPAGEFASVSAGYEGTCGVRTNGALSCWGMDINGEATLVEGEFALVSGVDNSACGLQTNGAVACWDIGWGVGVRVLDTPPGNFASVSGGRSGCGLRTNGAIVCWMPLGAPPEGEFASVSARFRHICGVRTDGDVACGELNLGGESTPPGNFASSIRINDDAVCVVNGGARICWNRSYDPK